MTDAKSSRKRTSRHSPEADVWPYPALRRRLKRNIVEIDRCEPAKNDPRAIDFSGDLLFAGVYWRVTGRLTRHEATGVLALSGVGLQAADPRDTPVTVRLLHRVPITRLIEAAVAWLQENEMLDRLADALEIPELPAFRGERARTRQAAKLAAASKLPLGVKLGPLSAPPLGAHGTPPEFYDQLAREAVEAAAFGRPVIAALEARYGGRPARTIKRWVSEAREAGSLDRKPRVWKLGPRFDREETK